MGIRNYLKRHPIVVAVALMTITGLVGADLYWHDGESWRLELSLLSIAIWSVFALVALGMCFKEENIYPERLSFEAWVLSLVIGILMSLLSFLSLIHSF